MFVATPQWNSIFATSSACCSVYSPFLYVGSILSQLYVVSSKFTLSLILCDDVVYVLLPVPFVGYW